MSSASAGGASPRTHSGHPVPEIRIALYSERTEAQKKVIFLTQIKPYPFLHPSKSRDPGNKMWKTDNLEWLAMEN